MKMDEDAERLRKIEEDLFFTFIKKEVETEKGTWQGSLEENRLADTRVSEIVRKSFKNYEKTKKKFDPAYFVKKEF